MKTFQASILSLFLILVLHTKAANPVIPIQSPGMKNGNQNLFYIERSKNKNRVYYDANLTSDNFNDKKPIDVYWINYEEHFGERGELSIIQEKLAYGYKSEKRNSNLFNVKLKAFDKRPLLLFIDNKGVARAQIRIAGKPAYLKKIFVQSSESAFSVSVKYVELFGYDPISKVELYEKIIP